MVKRMAVYGIYMRDSHRHKWRLQSVQANLGAAEALGETMLLGYTGYPATDTTEYTIQSAERPADFPESFWERARAKRER